MTDQGSFRRYFAVTLFGIITMRMFFVFVNADSEVHNFTGRCGTCHLNLDESVEDIPDRLLFTKDVNVLCRECHAEHDQNSHPTGTTPTMLVPADMPLNSSGEISCITCHFPHESYQNPASQKNLMLLRRRRPGKTFCMNCHPGGFESMRLSHESVLTLAHSRKRKYRSTGTEIIDKASQECISCHDDSFAFGADMSISTGEWLHDSGVRHPIGKAYPDTFPDNRYYRPIETLDPAIRLTENGKIGCATCHDKFSPHDKYLVMSNNRSRLCLSCHDK